MKLHYGCKQCGAVIAVLKVDYVDEHKFGFDCLTSEERADIINMDYTEDTMYIKALCDACVDAMDSEPQAMFCMEKYILH